MYSHCMYTCAFMHMWRPSSCCAFMQIICFHKDEHTQLGQVTAHVVFCYYYLLIFSLILLNTYKQALNCLFLIYTRTYTCDTWWWQRRLDNFVQLDAFLMPRSLLNLHRKEKIIRHTERRRLDKGDIIVARLNGQRLEEVWCMWCNS